MYTGTQQTIRKDSDYKTFNMSTESAIILSKFDESSLYCKKLRYTRVFAGSIFDFFREVILSINVSEMEENQMEL